MKKISIALVLLTMVLFSAYSCAPTVSQEEYDKVNNELSAAQSQLNSLQSQLDEAKNLAAQSKDQNAALSEQNDKLNDELASAKTEYEKLSQQKDAVGSELAALQAKYADLDAKYQELIKTPAPIAEGDLEQAIFALINQERTEKGLTALLWGSNIYADAKNNGKNMATDQRLEYPMQGAYREAYRATGYTEVQEMSEAVLNIWKNTELYDTKFLNSVLEYGVIGVYKSGEVYNITYIADRYK
jgi:uncharacterized protein YkwD